MRHYTDTHAHIYLPELATDIPELIGRADKALVKKVALPNIDRSTTDAMKATANMHAHFHPMIGLHPCSVKPASYKEELEHVEYELRSGYQTLHGRSYCAVGEIGIDLYWDKSTLSIQRSVFEQQMGWAHEHGLAVAVHCRNAYDEVIGSISAMGNQRPEGVLHCFTGTLQQAEALIELGFLLGIGGVVTFKNSGLDKVVEHLAMEHLVLETDSPYLAPAPYRGKRNEPAYVALVAEHVARIKGLSDPLADVGIPTTRNAYQLFKWKEEKVGS